MSDNCSVQYIILTLADGCCRGLGLISFPIIVAYHAYFTVSETDILKLSALEALLGCHEGITGCGGVNMDPSERKLQP